MYRKLIACLLVFFLFCSPAYAASTSGSVYDVMLMSAVPDDSFNVSLEVGEYNIANDSYNRAAVITPFAPWSNPASDTFCVMPGDFGNQGMYYYSKFGLSNLNIAMPSSFRFVCSNVLQAILVDPHYLGICSAAVPFMSYVELDITGSVKYVNNNSFISRSDTIIVPYASFANAFRNDAFGFVQDWDISLDLSLPTESVYIQGDEYKWHSATVTGIRFVSVYSYNNTFARQRSSTGEVSFADGDITQILLGVRSDSYAYITVDSLGAVSGGSDSSAIQSSITGLQTTITTQLNSVKSAIDNSTTTITTKIDTMASDIKTGLDNVVSSAKENTKQIIDTVTEKVDEVTAGISEVKDSILDLPNKMQEMLTDFIVPDEDAVADKMTDFQGLAEEKLGIIYQVPEMMFDAVNALVNGATNPQSTMTFPAFSLPWIDGSQLRVWDSQEFEIIPSGLENLRDLIQTVTSMVFVIMTFNSLKRAYERFFLGGGS